MSTGILGAVNSSSKVFKEPDTVPNYGPSRTVSIAHYGLKLSLEPVLRTYTGSAKIRFQPLPTYTGTLELDFTDATLDSVTSGSGESLDYRHLGHKLEIDAGEHTTIVLNWHGGPPSAGLYFTGPIPNDMSRPHMVWSQCQDEDGHHFFPCHDHPSVKHAWSIELDAPAGYRLLSNGLEVDVSEKGGRSTATYEQAEPMAAYLFTVVAGKLDQVDSEWRGRPVRYFVPAGRTEAVARSMGRTPEMMEAFSKRLGVDYPWSRYDQVVVDDFIFGGMENVACTSMADVLLVDEKAAVHWDPEGLVSHELAHQWFGDLLTCQDWSQAWLNESWATYMEALWWEADRSVEETTWYRWGTLNGYFDEERSRYRRSLVSYNFKEPIDVFDRHLYNKGSGVLHTMRGLMGEGSFWAGVKLYLERHRHGTVHTRHFQRAMEDASGTNLDAFFQQWVWSSGHPELSVSLSESDGLLMIGVAQTQSGDETPDVYHFQLPIQVVYEDGSTLDMRLPVRQRDRSFAVPVEKKVRTVRVDPGYQVLSVLKLKASVSWLKPLILDDCPVLSVRAASALIDMGSAEAMKVVREGMLSHPFWGVRGDIGRQLGMLGGPLQREALLKALVDEKDPKVRTSVLSALGSFREAEVATQLMNSISSVDTWHVQAAGLVALGSTRDPRAIDYITEYLSVDSWQHTVKMRSLVALSSTRDPAVLDTLMAYSGPSHPTRIRSAAAEALATLAIRVESVRTVVVERLVEMLSEPGYRCKYIAIVSLGRVKDPRALGALSALHQRDPDGRFKRCAYESMAQIRTGRTTEEGLASIRRQIDKLEGENAKLRDRIEKLESRLDASN